MKNNNYNKMTKTIYANEITWEKPSRILSELDKYLEETVKNNEKCNKCTLRHDDSVDSICYFAYNCIKNNNEYFKEDNNG